MSWTTEGRRGTCGNTFKTVGKAFLIKLFERMPRACKAVIEGYFEESQI
jgi:hypothetical protein